MSATDCGRGSGAGTPDRFRRRPRRTLILAILLPLQPRPARRPGPSPHPTASRRDGYDLVFVRLAPTAARGKDPSLLRVGTGRQENQ